MDRKTLLALALSMLVIVIWSSLFAPKRRVPDDRTGAPAPEVTESGEPWGRGERAPAGRGRAAVEPAAGAAAPPPGEVSPATPSQLGQAQAAAPDWERHAEEQVAIGTDLAVSRISTVGGGLVDARLLDFPSHVDRGVPVNLVRPGHQVLDVTLVWRDPAGGGVARVEPLVGVPFAVVGDRSIGGTVGGRQVRLEARRGDGLTVTRTYIAQNGTYVIDHTVAVSAPAGVTPPDLVQIGWRAGLPGTEGGAAGMRMRGRMMNGLALVGDEMHEWNPDSFKKNGPAHVEGNVRWAGVRSKYFLAALIPTEGTAVAAHADGDGSSSRNEVWIDVPLSSATGWQAGFQVYVGPADLGRLSALGAGIERAVRLGPSLIRPLGRLMLGIINRSYRLIPNYGVVIILVSVLIRVVLHPLNRTSLRSMKAMQELQPEMEALKKKYADKPQDLNKRMMALYKERGANPLGGCLPMLLQMPFLFALYYVLMFSVDLRMAPFIGWIDDLSAPDTIGTIRGFQIHVLPLVMTGVSVLQARSTPKDPRQAAMTTMMPVVFLFLFYSMPSGLVMYWTTMNVMAWAQQAMMNRGDRQPKAVAAGSEEGRGGEGAGGWKDGKDGKDGKDDGAGARATTGRAEAPSPDGGGSQAAAGGDSRSGEAEDAPAADRGAPLAVGGQGGRERKHRRQKRRKR